MAQLRIQLLGGFLLEWDNRPVPPIASKAGRSLFAYLIVNRDRSHTRDLLAGTFWPDQPEQRARRRLSQALWQIQSVLSEMPTQEPYVLTTASTLAFNRDARYWLDVEELETVLADVSGESTDARFHDLSGAIELYRGDFLAGFYDEWVLVEQRRIRDEYLSGVAELLQLAKSRGDYDGALSFAHRLALHDPLREEAHREVMRLAYLTGRVNEALQQYERCRSILAEELGVEPSFDTEELYEEIAARSERGARPFTPAPNSPLFDGRGPVPFVGREQERAAVLSRMEETIGGRGGLILVEGEAGLGKTRLLTQVADDAHWRGLGVLWGESTATGTPYEPIAIALRRELSPLRARQLAQAVNGVWLREVAELVPELSEWVSDLPERVTGDQQEHHDRMRQALSEVLVGLASISPYLMVIEDVHDADPETLSLVRLLAGRLGSMGLLMCASYRGPEARDREAVWGTLRAVDPVRGVQRIVLTALSEIETAELVRRSLGVPAVAEEATLLLHKDTGGNPLFALETLRAIRDLEQTDAAAFLEGSGPLPVRDELPVAGTVHDLISERFATIPSAARTALETAAVHGPRPVLDVISDTTALGTDVLAAVDELIRRGLMSESQGSLRFSHEQVRRVAYDALPAARRRQLHRDVGKALERRDLGTSAVLAHHFTEGQSWKKAVSYHRIAAVEAVGVLAFETAANHYEVATRRARAARLNPANHFDLLGAYEDVLNVLGRSEAQGPVLSAMSGLSGRSEPRRLDVLLRKARRAGGGGDIDKAVSLSSQAVDRSQRLDDGDWIERSLTAHSTYLVWAGRPSEAIPYLEHASQLLGADAARRAEVQLRLGSALAEVQSYEESSQALAGALADFEALGDLGGRARALGGLGITAMETGDLDKAEAWYREALELCGRMGYRRGEGVNHINLANLQTTRGLVAEALGSYDAAERVFRDVGEKRGEAMVLVNSSWLRISILGDVDRAVPDAARAREYFAGIGDARGEAECVKVAAVASRLLGDSHGAEDSLLEALELSQKSGHRYSEVQVCQTLAWTMLAQGDAAGAIRVADRALLLCKRHGLSDHQVLLEATAARAELALDNPDRAKERIEAAVDRITPRVAEPYLTWLVAHEVFTIVGDISKSAEALELAYQGLERCLSGLSVEERDVALDRVPEHREIVAAWEGFSPSSMRLRLAKPDAPTGRPLRPDETVDVTWSLDPDYPAGDASPAKRREALVSLLDQAHRQGGVATVAELANALGVSAVTIRRDLASLREAGYLPVTRGTRASR